MINIEGLRDLLRDKLEKSKGIDIAVFDVCKKTILAKYMILASGNSNRHVKSLAECVINTLKQCGKINQYEKINIDGMEWGNWVAVSFRGIIINILRLDVREYYQLDELWNNIPL